MEIFDTNDSFDFEKLILTKPSSISGGNYFIRFLVNSQPLYIQPPKCKTRQGIVRAGKRLYSDLMFTNENEDFIRWMENLENYCQQYIYKNREKWFEGEMELHDIENYFTSPLKLFKSGKYYLARTNITVVLGKPSLKIYDGNEKEVDFENIGDDTDVMTILEIQGIKCSAKSFQIEIELKQMMVLQSTNIFEKCIIKNGEPVEKNVTNPRSFIDVVRADDLRSDCCAISTDDDKPIEEKIEEELVPEVDSINENMVFKTDDEVIPDEESKDIVIDIPKESLEDAAKDLTIEEKTSGIVALDGLEEVEFHLEELTDLEPLVIKKRDNVYYEMYKEAKKKAKIARDLALSAYLEAKRIKNTYMLEDLADEDSDEEDSDEEDSDEEDSDEEESDEDSDKDIDEEDNNNN